MSYQSTSKAHYFNSDYEEDEDLPANENDSSWGSFLAYSVSILTLGVALGVWEYYFHDIPIKYDVLELENAYDDPEELWNVF
mmetsp:Transcript_4305/g.16228  ORF Transcript_4305/g.16228 Transcript_4305/m.16228 type:complete len:82 (-) Transcript_4305:153-398(-)